MKENLIMGSDLCVLLILTRGNCLLAGEREMMELEEMYQKTWLQLMYMEHPVGQHTSQPSCPHPSL